MKKWTSKEMEALAKDLYKWLVKHQLWVDVTIFYDGKTMSTQTVENGEYKFRYNGEPFYGEANPRTYFEYVANEHILSMSFEGPLNSLINYPTSDTVHLLNEFNEIFYKHGVWYELGNSWNLTCYPN